MIWPRCSASFGSSLIHRLVTILLALTLDLIIGDPPNRFHPVVLMGNWLNRGRRLAPADHRFWFGCGWTVAGIALFALPWKIASVASRRVARAKDQIFPGVQGPSSPLQALPKGGKCDTKYRRSLSLWDRVGVRATAAICLTLVFAYRNLRRVVLEVATALELDELTEARRLTAWHLVSRDTSELSAVEVAGAAIESLAENLTDSVTAPLLAYAVAGLPGAWAYRFVNTADAMWGYRTPEFEQLGKFPARLDDVLNWLPARLTGWAIVGATGLAGASARNARRTMLAQHADVTSLNAGWAMSAMAGALSVTLSKRGVYELKGGARAPAAADIRQALRVADVSVGLIVVGLIIGWGLVKFVREKKNTNSTTK